MHHILKHSKDTLQFVELSRISSQIAAAMIWHEKMMSRELFSSSISGFMGLFSAFVSLSKCSMIQRNLYTCNHFGTESTVSVVTMQSLGWENFVLMNWSWETLFRIPRNWKFSRELSTPCHYHSSRTASIMDSKRTSNLTQFGATQASAKSSNHCTTARGTSNLFNNFFK